MQNSRSPKSRSYISLVALSRLTISTNIQPEPFDYITHHQSQSVISLLLTNLRCETTRTWCCIDPHFRSSTTKTPPSPGRILSTRIQSPISAKLSPPPSLCFYGRRIWERERGVACRSPGIEAEEGCEVEESES